MTEEDENMAMETRYLSIAKLLGDEPGDFRLHVRLHDTTEDGVGGRLAGRCEDYKIYVQDSPHVDEVYEREFHLSTLRTERGLHLVLREGPRFMSLSEDSIRERFLKFLGLTK